MILRLRQKLGGNIFTIHDDTIDFSITEVQPSLNREISPIYVKKGSEIQPFFNVISVAENESISPFLIKSVCVKLEGLDYLKIKNFVEGLSINFGESFMPIGPGLSFGWGSYVNGEQTVFKKREISNGTLIPALNEKIEINQLIDLAKLENKTLASLFPWLGANSIRYEGQPAVRITYDNVNLNPQYNNINTRLIIDWEYEVSDDPNYIVV